MWSLRLVRKFGNFADSALKILNRFDRFDPKKFDIKSNTKDFGLDSLDTVEFVIAMEDELKIELNDEEALAITTVEEALNTFKKYNNSLT